MRFPVIPKSPKVWKTLIKSDWASLILHFFPFKFAELALNSEISKDWQRYGI